MAAKKKAEPVVSQPLTNQVASTAAGATEPNARDVQSSQAPAEVQAKIPIKPYPDVDEPYLQSFKLLRNNAYEAAFSLGRLANVFRFSQFLFYYRNLCSRLDLSDVFLNSIDACLLLLDKDTRLEVLSLLIDIKHLPVIPRDRYEPFDDESLWSDQINSEDRKYIPLFRAPLSSRYRFSLDSRAEQSAFNDRSSWLDCFEVLYGKLSQGDRGLANWMLLGWKVDRLVRPELEIDFLVTDYLGPRPFHFRVFSIAPATIPSPFDLTLMRCTLNWYSTQTPMDRNNDARTFCSLLGSSSIALELPQSSEEFETTVSNWVRLRAAEQLRDRPNSAPNGSSTVPNAPGDWEQKALLASLNKKRKLYVFCGRIWKQYRDESNTKSLESTDGTAAKKLPQIAESFKFAVHNGWNIDKRELFIKYAREGIKQNKPWSEFVNGIKGEKIPLKNFLT